jgi:hypothetical protein
MVMSWSGRTPSSPSEPSYWSIATGLVTLLSIIAGVLVHRLIPGLVLLALAMVFAAIIWRFRTLRYWEVSFSDTARDRWLWISVAGEVLLALLFVGLITNGSNGSDQTVQASPRVAEVTGCMKAHGLSHAFQELPAKDISSRDALEKPIPGDPETRRTFAWCDWPRPSWAQADGYTEVTVTELQGPDLGAAENDLALRIKAPCEKLKMAFTFVHQDIGINKPFTAKVGSLVAQDGSPWQPRTNQSYSEMRMAFSPRRDEVVVITSTHFDLDYVKCAA